MTSQEGVTGSVLPMRELFLLPLQHPEPSMESAAARLWLSPPPFGKAVMWNLQPCHVSDPW